MQNLFSQSNATLSVEDRLAAEALIVDVDGFEGPLDLLLTLSRSQKVDLMKISILTLARQYLAKEGATVALWDVLDGEEVANKIAEKGGSIFYQKVDVTNVRL